jgi:hypothetical protein
MSRSLRSMRSRAARCRTRFDASAWRREAIYLADRIVLMTNGPNAVLAEIVENPLPKERKRNDVHRHPLYYAVRNHVIDFLVSRSRSFNEEITAVKYDRRYVPVVRPGIPDPAVAADSPSVRWPRAEPSRSRHTRRRRKSMQRADVTEKILDIKREKGWSWK